MINKIFNEDCLVTIDKMKQQSLKINCIITSPPYNVDLGKTSKTSYSLYKDNKEHQEYIKWLSNIFDKCYDILEDGGRLCINIGDSKNGAIPTHSDIIQSLVNNGRYIMHSIIIWDKKHTNARTCWGSWLSPSCPSYPTPFEYILIFSKNNRKLSWKGETDLTKEEFIENAYGIWTFSPEKSAKKIGHPAPFPIELPKRLIKMNTYVNDIVYDPFMGSGSTALACIKTDRRFIGSEIDPKYVKIAEERIDLVK